mmetsp:Transcript_27611/g.51330  ORF Transcript_27611/g.51330 Transcript_27611/m.51330 type:complete len:137 (+) Transcript_27611:475-885(+)
MCASEVGTSDEDNFYRLLWTCIQRGKKLRREVEDLPLRPVLFLEGRMRDGVQTETDRGRRRPCVGRRPVPPILVLNGPRAAQWAWATMPALSSRRRRYHGGGDAERGGVFYQGPRARPGRCSCCGSRFAAARGIAR